MTAHRLEGGRPPVVEPSPRGYSPPRRICVVGSGWYFTSGISYYTCRLARALGATPGIQVSALLMRKLMPTRLYPGRARVGRPVNELRYPPDVPVFDGVDWYWSFSLPRALAFLRQQRPELTVLQTWTATVLHTYAVLIIAARLLGSRVVLELHEIGADSGELRLLPGTKRYGRAMWSLLLRLTDSVVAHSEFDRTRIREEWPRYTGPIHVLPHGPFDHYLPAPDDPALAAVTPVDSPDGTVSAHLPAGIGDDDTVLLYFGTIRPYKGLEHLVSAFGELDREVASGMRLVIVGETWEGWTLPLDIIREHPHRDRITVVNRYVHDREAQAVFARADAVVLPYLRSSSSGPLHIGMAHGLPMIVSDVGGLRESAGDYGGIIWVEPDSPAAVRDALTQLPDLLGQRFADQRTWQDNISLYETIMQRIPRRKRSGPGRRAVGQ